MVLSADRRTTRRHFLFVPDVGGETKEILWYCLAVTANKFDIAVHVKGVAPRFFRELHRLLALSSDLLPPDRISRAASQPGSDLPGRISRAAPTWIGSPPRSATTADLDGNGHLDVLTANSGSGDVTIRLGKGDGSFFPAQAWMMGDRPWSVAASDLDNDGQVDVLTSNRRSDDVSIRLDRGVGP